VDSTSGLVTDYLPNIDFVVTGRQLAWATGRGPAVGAFYSIKYAASLEWIAQVPPAPRYERGTPLGQRVVLKLRHLVFKQ
jgi:hypothetical protein